MTSAWFPPEIEPLTRLRVAHGMAIEAEDWQVAHNYHRDRQNLAYQSIYQGGIVRGLEVCPIAAPTGVPATYRDGYWVQVRPGIAIDSYGNIIVVPEPVEFRFASRAIGSQEREVFLVLRYVDPERLQGAFQAQVRETFRLDETSAPPQAGEIELCRLRLQADLERLSPPADPIAPEAGTIDARFRPAIRPRPETVARVGIWGHNRPQARAARSHFTGLLRACEGLYPPLWGGESAVDLLPPHPDAEALAPYDLVYLTGAQGPALEIRQLDALEQYLARGGNLWIEIPPDDSTIAYLSIIRTRLRSQLAWLDILTSANEMAARLEDAFDLTILQSADNPLEREARLEAELAKADAAIVQERERFSADARQLVERLGISLTPWEALERDRPELLSPFQFDALPALDGRLFQLWLGRGATVILGNLSAAWGANERISLERTTIRTAQELGINLLQVACRRRQVARASFSPPSPSDNA